MVAVVVVMFCHVLSLFFIIVVCDRDSKQSIKRGIVHNNKLQTFEISLCFIY